jgi:hypothetical protein
MQNLTVKPTSPEEWLKRTSLLLDMQVDAVLREKPEARLAPDQLRWFYDHVDVCFRYLHATNLRWRKWLEDRDRRIDPRLQARVWIRHWLQAYLRDPAEYQKRHPHSIFNEL